MSNFRPLSIRFWEKVRKGTPYECWVWLGARSLKGYGRINVQAEKNGQKYRRSAVAPRIAWELTYGRSIPPKLCVLHSCDNPSCVNPNHLRLGTFKDNSGDAKARGQLVLPPTQGIHNSQAKLSEENIRQIRRLTREGSSRRALARCFKVDRRMITFIIQGRNWRHVQD